MMLAYFGKQEKKYVGPFSAYSAPNGTCVIDSIIAMHSVWWLALPSVAQDGYPTPYLYTYMTHMDSVETFHELKLTFGVKNKNHRIWRKPDGSLLDDRSQKDFDAAVKANNQLDTKL